MSASDARRATAQHAMQAASQRDRLLVEVLKFEQTFKKHILADLELATMPPYDANDETLLALIWHVYALRRIAHEITGGATDEQKSEGSSDEKTV